MTRKAGQAKLAQLQTTSIPQHHQTKEVERKRGAEESEELTCEIERLQFEIGNLSKAHEGNIGCLLAQQATIAGLKTVIISNMRENQEEHKAPATLEELPPALTPSIQEEVIQSPIPPKICNSGYLYVSEDKQTIFFYPKKTEQPIGLLVTPKPLSPITLTPDGNHVACGMW